jgi:hypothetical protein
MCGLSDSFTSEVTCPVIICVKLKRSEFATFDEIRDETWVQIKHVVVSPADLTCILVIRHKLISSKMSGGTF